jgi:cytochrome P450
MKRWIPADMRKNRAAHLACPREKVLKRPETKRDRKDFIHYILKQGEHYDLSHDEIVVNAAFFLVVGSETTAAALSSLVNNLRRYPDRYAKFEGRKSRYLQVRRQRLG